MDRSARLAEAVPTLLTRLGSLPSGVCHGDATPDNFREPGDGTVVALDWSYGHTGQVGSDLAAPISRATRADLVSRRAAVARFGIDLALDIARA